MAKTETKVSKVPAMKLLVGSDKINASIASIKSRSSKLEREIHVIACSVLAHADKHGDITLAVKLVDALPSMARKNALRDWMLAFGKLDYDMEQKTFVYAKKKSTDMQAAIETPFWEFKPEKEYIPFDLTAKLQSVWKQAQKAADRGDDVPTEMMNQLKALVDAGNDPLIAKAA